MKKSIGFSGQVRVCYVKKLSITLFFTFVLAGPLASTSAFGEAEKTCAPPYKPSNIFKVMFSYSEGMDYISSADSACSESFADELVETFRDSMWVSKGCLDVTIEDVEEAKAKRAVPTAGVPLNKSTGGAQSQLPFIVDIDV
ncbi:MAG: hypothetical protein ACQ9MH_03160 [Nitrospinales bacterium]